MEQDIKDIKSELTGGINSPGAFETIRKIDRTVCDLGASMARVNEHVDRLRADRQKFIGITAGVGMVFGLMGWFVSHVFK